VLGADAAEVDVRVTRDGVAVLAHDRLLWRLARLPIPTFLLSYDQLVRAYARRGAAVATLADALQACPPELRLVLDVKTPGSIAPTIDAVLAARRRDVLIWCRDPASLARVRARVPWAQLALLRNTGGRRTTLRYLRDAVAAGADAVSLHQRAVTPEIVAAARDAGLIAYAWAVAEPAHQAVLDARVDGIVTDWPRVARALVGPSVTPAAE
jgi:glycerophosphoryl diester phosphodiesterase